MASGRRQYSQEELLALQHSPLIKRPDNLPRIEQWIEQATGPAERRVKATTNAKGEDGEAPVKRPSLFESRASKKSQSGEDIFLGPKMSFSAASAARHKDKSTIDTSGEKTTHTDEPRQLAKFDRFAKDRVPRELEGRDRDNERQRGRFGQNGTQDEELESRPRRGGDYMDRNKDQKDGGASLDGSASNRRSGPPRGKFEQPWFKDSSKPDGKDNEGEARSSWRDRERRNDDRKHDNPAWGRDVREPRVEREPGWMKDSQDDGMGHTMEDFAKWKEQMKAAEAAANGTAQDEDKPSHNDEDTFGPASATAKEIDMKPALVLDGPLFGIWGGKPSAQPATPVAKPVKTSRFASVFAPKQEEQPVLDTLPLIDSKAPSNGQQRPISTTDEDQQGFQRMMQMLRLGGSSSVGPQQQAIAMPPSQLPASSRDVQPTVFDRLDSNQPSQTNNPSQPPGLHAFAHNGSFPPQISQLPSDQSALGTAETSRSAQQSIRPATSHMPREANQHFDEIPMPTRARESSELERGRPPNMTSQMLGGRPETAPPARPEPGSRDSEFLFKLMHGQRQPFSEAQIYGQGYQRKDAIDMNSMGNSFTQRHPQQEGRVNGPPPGFSNANKQAFMAIQAIDMRHLAQLPVKDNHRGMMHMNDMYNGPAQHQIQDKYPPPNLAYDGGIPPWAGSRGGEHQQVPHAPPGFSAHRGSAPPGLPQFQTPNLASQHQTSSNGLRGSVPNPGQPPQYYGKPQQVRGLPQGFQPINMNNMPSQQQQQQQQQQRRPPMPNPISAQQQQSVYDPYLSSGRPGPPMQHQMNQMGYPPQHFMEQQRGPGRY